MNTGHQVLKQRLNRSQVCQPQVVKGSWKSTREDTQRSVRVKESVGTWYPWCLHQRFDLESIVGVVVGRSVSSSTFPSWTGALALFIARFELSLSFPWPSLSPVTAELLQVEDSGILPYFLLHNIVLPYICKTFYDQRSTSIHGSSFKVVESQCCKVSVISFILEIKNTRIRVLKKLVQSHKAGR